MKKKFICSLTTVLLGGLTLFPQTTLANTVKEDVNHDGVVSYDDYNLVMLSHGSNGIYDLNGDYKVDKADLNIIKAAIVPTGIKGDVNDDGVVTLEDRDYYSCIYPSTPCKSLTLPDGTLMFYYNPEDVIYGFDFANFDFDNDGYLTVADQPAFDKIYPLDSTHIKGDANNDGKVDIKDLNLLYLTANLTGFSSDFENSDLNNDGMLDFSDYNILSSMVK